MPANSTTPSSRSRRRTPPVAAPVSGLVVVSLMAVLPIDLSGPDYPALRLCGREAGTCAAAALASFVNEKSGGNHEIGTVAHLACARRGRRLVRGDHDCAIGHRQGAALPAAHHGSARREAEATRRADHEGVERRPRRSL